MYKIEKNMKKEIFGYLDKNKVAYLYTLENSNGMRLVVSDFGSTIIELWYKSNAGNLINVVLGYSKLENYKKNNTTYFGGTIGRNSNRISNSSFKLNNKIYNMDRNENLNNLHSGLEGYHIRLWEVEEFDEENNFVTFVLNSPSGDQGFPGNLTIRVSYQLTEDDEVIIRYFGKSDERTIFNPTNHSYFNLNGQSSGQILKHILYINSDFYTPVISEEAIPTGEILGVSDTPMDFNKPKMIGRDIESSCTQLEYTQGYDHNYVLNINTPNQAWVEGDQTGIKLSMRTTSPGLQFYSGNFLGGVIGKDNVEYTKHSGFCLEPQFYPDSINQKNFKSPILDSDKEIQYVTQLSFSCKK